GKHGVCGDPYNGVREHETGGTYGLFPTLGAKAIGACYKPGQTVDIQVQLTANHMGVFHFELCKLNGKHDKETEECFQTLVQPNGEKEWKVPPGNQVFTIPTTLPAGVTCDGDSHCVIRWAYEGGNNFGVGPLDQEWFWNCADVYISNTCGASPNPSPSPSSGAPVTDAPWTPTPSSNAPSTPPPVNPTAAPVPPPNGSCGTCNNCYYAPAQACFAGWTQDQCSQVSTYTWCGSNSVTSPAPQPSPSPSSAPWTPPPVNPTAAPVVPPSGTCGTCNNCYYSAIQACFVGWTANQCMQVPTYTWCGSDAAPQPSSVAPQPSSVAPVPSSNVPSTSAPWTQPPLPGKSGLANILPKTLFLQLFPNALPIYKYENFVAMAAKYPSFANTGDADVDRREVAAFLGQVSLESGDLRYVEEINKSTMCQASADYPCAAGKQYYGRGPIQLSWNYNYKDFGKAANLDLVASPELVATDPDLVWYSALWFWNAPKWNGNIHDVVGQPGGFAYTTYIINGGMECGLNPPNRESEKSRIASYTKFCQLLGVAPGDNLSCQTAAFPPKAPWTPAPSNAPTTAPQPSNPTGVTQTISWNWFNSNTLDCDGSLSKDTLNRGLYIGGENIPADCGKTATFSYNGKTVTATYAWRTTGGTSYHELSPQAFAKLLGSTVDVATIGSAQAMQAAINDPGHVIATCVAGKC
ncbi:hypothetical protein As57867_004483, partial [Aphanomyces stellatus]